MQWKGEEGSSSSLSHSRVQYVWKESCLNSLALPGRMRLIFTSTHLPTIYPPSPGHPPASSEGAAGAGGGETERQEQ